MDYNKLNALVYEAIQFISRFWPSIKLNPLVKLALENCLEDWVEFRTQVTLKELDEDIEELHAQWDQEEAEHFEYVFTEEEPDGSEAQKLLGGPMRLSAPWTSDKNEPSS
jgi:hypothetical protein|tara:strand:+ start:1348 stop:1677 length:330 start_codon:yes stop_codon:yes gene_type:complete